MDAGYVTNEILAKCFNKNPKLEKLLINQCNTITSPALKPAIIKCDKLLSINLVDCEWITEGFLDCLMEHKPVLNYLSIKGDLPCVSGQCVYRLMKQYHAKVSFPDSHIYTKRGR